MSKHQRLKVFRFKIIIFFEFGSTRLKHDVWPGQVISICHEMGRPMYYMGRSTDRDSFCQTLVDPCTTWDCVQLGTWTNIYIFYYSSILLNAICTMSDINTAFICFVEFLLKYENKFIEFSGSVLGSFKTKHAVVSSVCCVVRLLLLNGK